MVGPVDFAHKALSAMLHKVVSFGERHPKLNRKTQKTATPLQYELRRVYDENVRCQNVWFSIRKRPVAGRTIPTGRFGTGRFG